MKKLISTFLFMLISLILCSCTKGDVSPVLPGRIFTDDAGRKITLSETEKVIPSGPLAQTMIYTAFPEKLSGIARPFPNSAKGYIDTSILTLPVFGQLYGTYSSFNAEMLLTSPADILIDMGEKKANITYALDNISAKTNIPCVFIELTLDKTTEAYKRLGELMGDKTRTAGLADYSSQTLEMAERNNKLIKKKLKVYMALGKNGLNTNARGSFHAEIIEKVGGINVADTPLASSGGGTAVSPEQLILWNPDVILTDSEQVYKKIMTEKNWSLLSAVKKGKVYIIPSIPFSFFYSSAKLIGIRWLGNILYPDIYRYDIKPEIKNFYRKFYRIELDDTQYNEIMKNAFAN